ALIPTFEQFDLLASSQQPVILCHAEFLVHLPADGHSAVATGATEAHEFFQAVFRLAAQSVGIAFQITIEWRWSQQHALVSSDGFAPILGGYGFRLTWERLLEHGPIYGQRAQPRLRRRIVRVS